MGALFYDEHGSLVEFGTFLFGFRSHRRLFFKNPACGGPIWTFSSKRNFFFKTELFFRLEEEKCTRGTRTDFSIARGLILDPAPQRMGALQAGGALRGTR